jgi:hypothetical protein
MLPPSWDLSIVKHEVKVMVNLNIGKSQGFRRGRVFTPIV